MRPSRLILLVIAVGLMGLALWLSIRALQRRSYRDRFAGSFAELTQRTGNRLPPMTEPEELVGKILIIDRDKNAVDDLQFDLPDETRADTPEEVGTVIWIVRDMDAVKMGQYWENYQIADLTFIRRDTWEKTGSKRISGAETSGGKGSTNPWNGSKPVREILDYIAGLPRQ